MVFGIDLELRYVVGVAVMLGYTLPHPDGVFIYLFHLCLSLTVFVCFLAMAQPAVNASAMTVAATLFVFIILLVL